MNAYPDNNPDKLSGFRRRTCLKWGIQTKIPTNCRDTEDAANQALGHLAFNAPVLTRRQRADRMREQQAAFFNYYAPEAREILNDLLQKYAIDGELQFTLSDVLKVGPIWRHGNVAEIIGKFGGADQLRNALNQLQTLLYAA